MKSSILFVFFILVSAYTKCQKPEVTDSLIHLIDSSEDTEVKANTYILLGKTYFQSDFLKAIDCFNKAIDIGFKNNLTKSIADGYNNKGFALINIGEQSKARLCLDSALKFHKSIKNKKGEASVYANYGNLYFTMGDFTKSLEHFLICLKMREELNDKDGQGQVYNGIAMIYNSQDETEKALVWYRKCLDISREVNNKVVEVTAMVNMAGVFIKQDKFTEAKDIFDKSISLARQINNKEGEGAAYLGISKIAVRKNKFNEALIFLKKAEIIFIEASNTYKVNEIQGKLGDIYANQGDFIKAKEYYTLYLERAREMGSKKTERNALQLLSATYAELNNKDKAYQYLSEYTELNNEIQNEEKAKQLSEMQIKFETEKKESENVILAGKLKVQSLELSNNRYLMIGLGSLFILSVIIAWLIVRQNRLKFNQTSIKLEQKLLRSQMNPHFIFNSLTTIESFIYENQPKEAGRYLSDFARLMRQILESSSEEHIPLNKEIRMLEYYLVLQRLRLEGNLTFDIKTSGIDDIESIKIPPMLTQPFIENSIEHGFKGTSKGGHIEIEFNLLNKDVLEIKVTDNGKGINNATQNSQENKTKHKSMALQITKERLVVLNKSKKQKVTFALSDISDERTKRTGTMVVFTIPVV